MTTEPATGPLVETMRAWARGSYAPQAGVELLIRSGLAARLDQIPPWADGPGTGFDPALVGELIEHGHLSGGQQRIAAIAAALLDGQDHRIDLSEALAGLDRDHLDLVLAAIAHAAGSHEHGEVADGLDRPAIAAAPGGYLPPLRSWPAQR